MSKRGVFSGPYFPVFSPNAAKYGPEKLRIETRSARVLKNISIVEMVRVMTCVRADA